MKAIVSISELKSSYALHIQSENKLIYDCIMIPKATAESMIETLGLKLQKPTEYDAYKMKIWK